MKIFHTADAVLTNGEVVVVGRIYKNDTDPGDINRSIASHGETTFCQIKHAHNKSCAVTLIDQPLITERGDVIEGPTVREKIAAWFETWNTLPEDPVHVDMPKKTVTVVEDGKPKLREVDDRAIDSTDLEVIAGPEIVAKDAQP